MPHPAFIQTDHRPWPLPKNPWIMKQSWHDLLFLHWQVDIRELQDLIPEGLEIDTFEGNAYIGLVPFDMRGVTARGCPAPRFMCNFPEFNVRTYVTKDGKPGVWFFSLDITNSLAVWAAQTFFNLPYRKASVYYKNEDGAISYTSTYSTQESFRAKYQATKRSIAPKGSFANWATERYCLYTQDKRGKLYRGEIQHPQWSLWEVDYEITENTMLDCFTLGEMQPPLMAKDIDVVVFPLEKLS